MATKKSAAVTTFVWRLIGILKLAAVQPTREGTSKLGSKHSIYKSRMMGVGRGQRGEGGQRQYFPVSGGVPD